MLVDESGNSESAISTNAPTTGANIGSYFISDSQLIFSFDETGNIDMDIDKIICVGESGDDSDVAKRRYVDETPLMRLDGRISCYQ